MIRLSTATRAIALSVILPAALVARAEGAARYEAVFVDGARLDGEKISGWGQHPPSPRLDNTVLFDAKRPLQWLRDREGKPWRQGKRDGAYIEFVGGDRIVGRIVGASAGAGPYVPAHVLVAPAEPLREPVRGLPGHVRILPGRIERIVFKSSSPRRLEPGTLYYLNGRGVSFVRLRWRRDSVVLLLKDGTREVRTSEIAEVHLPPIDPWKAYYRELAILSPACRERLTRLETTGGLIATVSLTRLKALAFRTVYEEKQFQGQRAHYDSQIKQYEARVIEMGKAVDLARKTYIAKKTELQKAQAADRQTYEKALATLRQKIEQQRKASEASLADRQRKHEEQLRKSEADLSKRLAGKLAKQRDKQIRDLRARNARSRERHKKQLDAERMRLQRQRAREIAGFSRTEPLRISNARRPLAAEVAKLKQKLDSQFANHGHHTRHLNTLRQHRIAIPGPRGNSSTWTHIIHPVWSLDVLQVRFGSVRMLWSFAPDRVPLSRVRPVAAVSPVLLPWNTNRNAVGKPLRSGGRQYAWGFAVHAYNELRFPLPKCANAFRSRIGLDRIIGAGGCARARIYVGSTAGKHLYESPLLVGSKKTTDTGRIALAAAPAGPRHLVLQADPADKNRPRQADPLNIRDKLDWLDPRIELDMPGLQDQVRLQAGPAITASPGWKLKLDKPGVYDRTSHLREPDRSGPGRFLTMLRVRSQPLRFSREMTIAPADKWLAVHVTLATGETPRTDAVILRVGQRQIQPRKIPVRQRWQDWPAPICFGLDEYQGKKVTLELTQAPGGDPLHWQAVTISKTLPRAYKLARILELAGQRDLQIPQAMGLALHSRRMNEQERIALIEIYRHGGIINFRGRTWEKSQSNDISNVLVGEDWTGGDKTFTAFQKAPGLKSLILVKDSGVSSAAVEKLQAVKPGLKVTYLKRLPSSPGARSTFWMQNRTGKKVEIYWITEGGSLSLRDTLDTTGNRKKHYSHVGCRFEAHIDGKRISKFTVTPGRIWEIRPGQR